MHTKPQRTVPRDSYSWLVREQELFVSYSYICTRLLAALFSIFDPDEQHVMKCILIGMHHQMLLLGSYVCFVRPFVWLAIAAVLLMELIASLVLRALVWW